MDLQDASWDISTLNVVILAASVLEVPCRDTQTNRQTDRQMPLKSLLWDLLQQRRQQVDNKTVVSPLGADSVLWSRSLSVATSRVWWPTAPLDTRSLMKFLTTVVTWPVLTSRRRASGTRTRRRAVSIRPRRHHHSCISQDTVFHQTRPTFWFLWTSQSIATLRCMTTKG